MGARAMLQINCIKHASEVVCVAIGANLLLPVAPNILKKYLEYVDTSASNIIKTKFVGLTDYLSDDDFKAMAIACKKVDDCRKRCNCPQGMKWCYAELITVPVGVFLLWSNWIENPTIATWCPLLFLPVVLAVLCPYGCYVYFRRQLSRVVKTTLKNANKAKREQESENALNNNDFIVSFVEEARQAAEQV